MDSWITVGAPFRKKSISAYHVINDFFESVTVNITVCII